MKTVGPKDFYEVKRMNQISDLEWGYASDFYLPLLGPIPFAVYRMLYDDESAISGSISNHEKLFRKSQVSSGEFYHALECLEALALVKTYLNDEGGLHYFVYAIYAPRKPKTFLNNVLLTGTLKKYIGDDALKKLRDKYKTPEILPNFKDVSASFKDVYNPDYDFQINGLKSIDGQRSISESDSLQVKTDFNIPAFFKHLAKYGIREESVSPIEKERVSQYAMLYSIQPDAMAEIVSNCYNHNAAFGNRINFEEVGKQSLDVKQFPFLRGKPEMSEVSGESELARRIRYMDEQSPIKYLSALQNGTTPIRADASIAAFLTQDIGLSNGATNALIDYALDTNDNILSRAFCEKLAAAMQREGIKTARDAMDYLNGLRKKRNGIKKNKQSAKVTYEDSINTATEVKNSEKEKEPEEDLETLMARFYNQK